MPIRFNGNIADDLEKRGRRVNRKYDFSYDNVNRLTGAAISITTPAADGWKIDGFYGRFPSAMTNEIFCRCIKMALKSARQQADRSTAIHLSIADSTISFL